MFAKAKAAKEAAKKKAEEAKRFASEKAKAAQESAEKELKKVKEKAATLGGDEDSKAAKEQKLLWKKHVLKAKAPLNVGVDPPLPGWSKHKLNELEIIFMWGASSFCPFFLFVFIYPLLTLCSLLSNHSSEFAHQ